MKTILVPTDFSENAKVALDYTVQLSKEIGARIVLINCYQMPTGQTNVMIDFRDILEKDAIDELDKIIAELDEKDKKDVDIIPVAYYGFLEDGVSAMSKTYEIDLIVMGTAGASNLKNKLFGSNTARLIKKTKLPMIVVPMDAKWTGLKNINIAYDTEPGANGNVFGAVKNLIAPAKSHFDVVHVLKSTNGEATKEQIREIVENKLGGEDYEINFERAMSPSEGILNHIAIHPCDLLVMTRRDQGFLERLFKGSVTKELALHSDKPLLLYSN